MTGLILCGGASSRMGRPKALLQFQGETFAGRLARIFQPACDSILIVLGHDADRILTGLPRAAEIVCVRNPAPERGMLSSLQCGLRALPETTRDLLFTPVDYPAIRPSTIEQIADHSLDAPVVIPTCRAKRGHPVRINREVMDALLAAPAEAQARDIIRLYRDRTRFVEVDDPGILTDIDYPDDYRRLQEAS